MRGEPWLVKQEYQITEWDTGHVSAIMKDPPYQCLVTGLQIDFGAREVVFTETYTKSIENDAFDSLKALAATAFPNRKPQALL